MSFLIYGAYGYTGSLIAEEAASQGMDCVLAGRNAEKVHSLGNRLDRPSRTIALEDDAALDASLADVTCVLNCAGPFVRTASPVVEACFRTRTHYLDITGEALVLQDLASQHNRARASEITLLPAVGFDVVPSDCMAARVSDRLPGADVLEIAILAKGGFSRGTAKTALEQSRAGSMVRHKGRMLSVPPAWRSRRVNFGHGDVWVTSVPLGDLVTAYYSAQVPTIVTYARMADEAEQALKLSRYANWLLKMRPARNLLKQLVEKQPEGPSPKERERGTSAAWAQASRGNGETVISRVSCPEVYNFTVASALEATRRIIHGSVPHGFQTPATAFGHSFVESIDGVDVEDVL